MTNRKASIQSIRRYPVKGLSAESLASTRLEVGATLPADRFYAIENGPTGFDPQAPVYLPKNRFLMLMKNERLARLATAFDPATHVLTIRENAEETVRGDLRTVDGRAAIERFFAGYCADELRGPPRVLSGTGHSFSDVAAKVVSIINLASVAELARLLRVPVHPLRFRANLYVDGWPAWSELDLVGQQISIGAGARLRVVKRIQRCAATNVDPETGVRDLGIPQTLMQTFGHADCGIYAQVVTAGPISVGDPVFAGEA